MSLATYVHCLARVNIHPNQKTNAMRTTVFLTVTILLAAHRISRAADPTGGYQSQQGISLHGSSSWPLEGTKADLKQLEGTTADLQLEGATRTDQPYQGNLQVENGELVGTINGTKVRGPGVIGTKLSASDPTNFGYVIISNVKPHRNIYVCDSSPPVSESSTSDWTPAWEYIVEWHPTSSPQPAVPLCDGGRGALAVPGSWSQGQGQLTESNKIVSFACIPKGRVKCDDPIGDGGVVAKCIDYGYAPWAKGSPRLGQPSLFDNSPKLGQSTLIPNSAKREDSARKLHNLCAVAMRADYGGNGLSRTLDGTPIELFDVSNVPCDRDGPKCKTLTLTLKSGVLSEAPKETIGLSLAQFRIPFAMEGIWTITTNQGKLRARAVCLTKDRWAALDWQDPAVSTLPGKGQVPLCENFLYPLGGNLSPLLSSDQPLLFSFSTRIDKGLHHFWDGKKHDLTTSNVVITENKDKGKVEVALICPPACDCRNYKNHRFVGAILTPLLANDHKAGFEQSKQSNGLVPLYTYAKPKPNECSWVTLTDNVKNDGKHKDLSGYAVQRLEGYLQPTEIATPERSPSATMTTDDLTLYLWRTEQSSTSYVTDTRKPKHEEYKWPLGHLVRRDPVPDKHFSPPILWKMVFGTTPVEKQTENATHQAPRIQTPVRQ